MIDYKANNGDVKRAVFEGTLANIVAELCFEISLVYGSICLKDKKAGEAFKIMLPKVLSASESQDVIFSEDVARNIMSDDSYMHATEVSKQDERGEDDFLAELAQALFGSLDHLADEDEDYEVE